MDLSTDTLRCFNAAAHLLNFRAAARTVFLTPQAFSQRIRQLEETLGVPLFERTTRSVRLTAEGLRLLPAAEQALAAVARCGSVVRGQTTPTQLTLQVGTRHELGLSWLEPQLNALAKALPWLELNLYFGSGTDLVASVRAMAIDCAITSTRIQHDGQLEGLRLHQEDYAFVAAPKLLRRTPLTQLDQTQNHALLDIDDSLPLFRYWRDVAPGADLARFAKLRFFGTIEAVRRRVRSGDGVAVLPRYLVERDLKAKSLVLLFPKVKAPHDFFRLVFRAEDARRPAYEALATELRAVALS